MSERHTVLRSIHDLGMAAWFGGSLMGAVGLNGATADAHDPSERLRLSSLGWKRWAPVAAGAIALHGVGGAGLIVTQRGRIKQDAGSAANTWTKFGLTVAAAGLTAYSGLLGGKVESGSQHGAEGATEPGSETPDDVAKAQRQLKIVQWAIPVTTGILVVMGAQQGEQQRPTQQLVGRLTSGLSHS